MTQGDQPCWSVNYKSAAILATLSDTFIAIAYADATLHIHTLSGRRYLLLF
jgi:hypothetical protein